MVSVHDEDIAIGKRFVDQIKSILLPPVAENAFGSNFEGFVLSRAVRRKIRQRTLLKRSENRCSRVWIIVNDFNELIHVPENQEIRNNDDQPHRQHHLRCIINGERLQSKSEPRQYQNRDRAMVERTKIAYLMRKRVPIQ
jgi:hypothetical protein